MAAQGREGKRRHNQFGWGKTVAKHSYRMKVHDRFQLEIKFSLPLRAELREEAMRVEAFLFVPASLDINPNTYTKEAFYQDLKSYTRYGTPELTLAEVLDDSCAHSPFARLGKLREALRARPPDEAALHQADYELRILACLFRARTRSAAEDVERDLARRPQAPANLEQARAAVAALCQQAEKTKTRLRELLRYFFYGNSKIGRAHV